MLWPMARRTRPARGLPALAATALLASCSLFGCSFSRQVPDLTFAPPLDRPAYEIGGGPLVLVDEGHYNFHTSDGRYRPFAELLRRDGYVVRGSRSAFTQEALAEADVLVIANALHRRNRRWWGLPNPSAFEPREIAVLRDWVEGGGALFLIADHMPFPGAAEKLAAAFDVYFINGYAYDGKEESHLSFRRSDGTLLDHPITRGRSAEERIDKVRTFTGQAFRVEREVSPLMVFPEGSRVMMSVRPPVLPSPRRPHVPAAGLFQGAAFKYGEGRVAVFGEAAMFSAQRTMVGRRVAGYMGMNAPEAEQNPQLLLNVVHWLAGLIDP